MTEQQYLSGRTQIKLKTLNIINTIVSSSPVWSFVGQEDDRFLEIKFAFDKMHNELYDLKTKFKKKNGKTV